MARSLFGGSSDDYAVDSNGRPVAGRRVHFYTSAAMTTEITDLASDAAGTGSPLTVSTDSHGYWGPVYGPDSVTVMYAGTVDAAGNPPAYVVAVYTHTQTGGGAAGVASFNTRTGAITLSKADVTGTALAAADVGADASGAAATAQTAAQTYADTAVASRAKPRGAWVTATAYAVNDVVTSGGAAYRCLVAHTSGASFSGAGTNWEAWGSAASLPVGGTTGQYLKKNSATDGDAGWATLPNIPATLFFNVKDTAYGAVGNSNGTTGNGTDDTTAINAAITACVAAGGGTVFFPAGTYRVTTAALTITASSVCLLGAARGAARIFFDTLDNSSYGGVLFDGGASSGTITGNSLRSITVFNRSGATNTAGLTNQGWDGVGCRVTLRGCSQFVVDDVEVYNAPNYGIVTIRSTDGSIYNCDAHDNLADGIHIHSGSQRVTVANNHVTNTLDDGIAVNAGDVTWGPVTDVTIVGNTVENIGNRGISVMSPAQNIVVSGNAINNTVDRGINVSVDTLNGFGVGAIAGVVISGNTVLNAGMYSVAGARGSNTGACGIYAKPGNGYDISGLTIADNVIVNARNGYIWTEGNATNKFVHQLVVSGNTGRGIGNVDTLDGHNPGIRIRSCSNAKVTGNSIYGSWHEAVLADATNAGAVQVTDNVWTRCNLSPTTAATKNGMTITSGKPIVSGNSLLRSIVAATESLTSAVVDANNNAVSPGTAAGDYMNASDTMTKANGALAGTTGQAGPAWAAIGSGHTISSNKAVATFVGGGQQYYTVVDTGQADQYAEATMTLSATATHLNNGVVLRAVDASNVIKAVIFYSGTAFTYYLAARTGGSDQVLQQGSLSGGLAATMTNSSTHTIAALVSNGTVYMLLDGTLVAAGNLQTSWTALWTATKAGIASFTATGNSDDGTVAFTNFKATN